MSTAALQSVPHQSRNLATNSSVAALPPGRPCTSGMTQAREGYFAPSPLSNSSSPAWRSSRRPSSVSGTPANNISQSQIRSMVNTPSPSTSSRIHHLSLSPAGAPVEQLVMAPGDTLRGVPPVISPRTSSNRASHNNSSLAERSSSRKNGAGENQSPQQRTDNEAYHSSRDRHTSIHGTAQSRRGNEDRIATSTSRRAQSVLGEMSPEPIPQNREKRVSMTTSTSTSRQKTGKPTDSPPEDSLDTNSSTGPSREVSKVLNRIVVSQPEVDIERERERMAELVPAPQGTPVSATGDAANKTRSTRSRHEHTTNPTKREKNIKFGEYYLGGTLGEGEFGKVKMGWKQEGGVQVAIKLIRRDSVGTNPTRLAKIYREIAILREISHPNIVRLHEMVETEKQIGIILEYASGGELFDYILNHRYLKDNAARRLFAQLVSGVGYLHKKGIVHRDLKLENLLLDRNRNIIITDFGFANTFNANDELSEEIEYNLGNKEFVKKTELDKVLSDGHRRGDLMQTSCGSPCYAAPELVVSDSLYTGRKVDVWSCGVILYAMLAGYLPFDDDPANPEGDNINLLYKYIVSTPLTFPEYVSPHARDLLRRILVPDPRKRADLFEVARHSWLAEYAHVVSFITCTATMTHEISPEAAHTHGCQDVPILSRSASVREPVKSQKSLMADSDLPRKHGKMEQESHESHKASKDNKRRTVQVEYVAPRSETQRGSHIPGAVPQSSSKKRVRAGSQGSALHEASPSQNKLTKSDVNRDQSRVRGSSTTKRQSNISQIPTRCDPKFPNNNISHHTSHSHPPVSLATPNTGGSLTPTVAGSRPASMHLTSRSSYSKPVAPTLAGTNVQGQMTQPKGGKSQQLNASEVESVSGCESVPGRISNRSGHLLTDPDGATKSKTNSKGSKGHRRSNTIGGFFSRTNSVFGSGVKRVHEEKPTKKYPPVSKSAMPASKEELSRQSIDSRRSVSFGFARKRSGSISNSQTTTLLEKPRRFSLLPTAFSLRAIGSPKDVRPLDVNQASKYMDEGEEIPEPATSAPICSEKNFNTTGNMSQNPVIEGQILNSSSENPKSKKSPTDVNPSGLPSNPPILSSPSAFRQGRAIESESSIMEAINVHRSQISEPQHSVSSQPSQKSANGRGLLQKNNRRFADAYEQELGNGFGTTHSDHAGSSGAARKVMDFFRRRGRDRGL